MSAKYLGPFFDIHCGGEDHISVHHTNEIAQTEACYGTRLANFWMHAYFLQVDESVKMSKSSGDFLRLETLVEQGYDPLAYRMFCLNASYRQKLNFSVDGLDAAEKSLERLRTISHELGEPGAVDVGFVDRFTEMVNDDLNMPRSIALTWELVRTDLPSGVRKATLLKFDEVLGLGLADWQPKVEEAPAEVLELLVQRQQARAEKRWKDADALRDQINAAGWELMDTPEGPKLKPRK